MILLHKKKTHFYESLFMDTGIAILSQVPADQVPSPLRVLTSEFGMRSGGTLALKTPVMVESPKRNIHNCIAKITRF